MHGLLFLKLRRYADKRLTPEAWPELVRLAGPITWEGDITGVYPDGEFMALLTGVATLAKEPVAQVMEHFGFNLVPTLLEMAAVLGLVKQEWRTLELIKHTPDIIHPVLLASNPQLVPPFLLCEFTSANELLVAYRSPRQLCGLLRGIVRGIAAHYRQNVEMTEEVCVLKGGAGCRFRLVVTKNKNTVHDPRLDSAGLLPSQGVVRLFNTFRGVPISYPGVVAAATRKTAQIQTHKNQLVAAQEEGTTLVTSPAVSRVLKGRLKGLDWPQQAVHLEEFEAFQGTLGQRTCIRIGVTESLRVEVEWQGKSLRGLIQDLSVGGVGVSLTSFSVGQEILFSTVPLTFFLPGKSASLPARGGARGELHSVEASGDVVGVVPSDHNVVLRIRFKRILAPQRALLEQYIMQRQLNVLRELHELVR